MTAHHPDGGRPVPVPSAFGAFFLWTVQRPAAPTEPVLHTQAPARLAAGLAGGEGGAGAGPRPPRGPARRSAAAGHAAAARESYGQ